MTEMVERVAIAIFGDLDDDTPRESNADLGRYGPPRSERLAAARAAIEAMRSVDNDMRKAGLIAYLRDIHEPSAKDAQELASSVESAVAMTGVRKGDELDYIWQAMINTALGEEG